MKKTLLIIILLFLNIIGFSQCINTFPYIENFENNPSWTTGSIGPGNNDWTWGIPNKPVISSAGSGQKCWIIGGLSGLTYANGERSYIQSPCFDFTNLQHPYITFLVFWESEWKYDGAVLQYSLNGGSSWSNLGSVSDPVDCMDSFWFNQSSVTNLGLETIGGVNYPGITGNLTRNGWSGNIQSTTGGCQGGNGLGHWVLARHCMSILTGKSNVIFRFGFGAGTSCNKFDGFAVDSICIREAPENFADFRYSCTNTTIQFDGISTSCTTNSYLWNFGDGSTSNIINPSHNYNPGIYNVTFTTSGGPCNSPGTITKTIHILSDSINVKQISCYGKTDDTIIITTNGNSPYIYNWGDTTTGNEHIGFPPGNHNVIIKDSLGCSNTLSININQPSQINVSTSSNKSCIGFDNGSASIFVSGGTPPYTYHWNPTNSTTSSLTNIGNGQYNYQVTDKNNCYIDGSIFVLSDSCIHDTIPNPIGSYSDTIYVPNSFTPNGDGINDLFEVFGNKNQWVYLNVNIFNRWGEKVFESNDINFGWDGRYKGELQNPSVFVYYITIVLNNGDNFFKKGSLTLIR